MKTYQVVVVFEVEADSLEQAETTVEVWADGIQDYPERLPDGCAELSVAKEDDEDNDGQRVYYFSPRVEAVARAQQRM
jgi:hypothetical protein